MRKNRPNPDDRRDNAEKIEYNIGKTIQNMRQANDTIELTDDSNTKKALKQKNKRRDEALKAMREEIRDEAIDKRNGYK